MQQSLLTLDFKIIEDAQNHTASLAAVTGKRDMPSVIQQAKNNVTWKQTPLPQLFGQPKTEQTNKR